MSIKSVPVRVMRVSQVFVPILDNQDSQCEMALIYQAALNDPYATGSIVSLDVAGKLYSIEEVRSIING